MGYVPHYNRRIPIAASGSTETILAQPRPASRGGNGWSGAKLIAAAGGTTTTFVVATATGIEWSEFEVGALDINDRFTGSMLVLGGRPVYITDHVFAAGNATFTFTPAVLATDTDAGSLAWLAADIPLAVSQVLIKTVTGAANLAVNTRTAGGIAAGEFLELLSGESFMVLDTESGSPGRSVFIRSMTIAASSADVHVMVP